MNFNLKCGQRVDFNTRQNQLIHESSADNNYNSWLITHRRRQRTVIYFTMIVVHRILNAK